MSASDEAIEDGDIDLNNYKYVDLILGEEKKTTRPKRENEIDFRIFSVKLQKNLTAFCESGGNLFISGAHVGTDVFKIAPVDSMDIKFARDILKYRHRTNHAVKKGTVYASDSLFKQIISDISFNTSYHNTIYTVEAPDAIEPVDTQAQTIFRYEENNMSAAVAYKDDYRLVIFGFPFESIIEPKVRNLTMKAVFNFFTDL